MPSCPGAQLSSAQLSLCPIVLVPSCPVPNCFGAQLFRCPIVLVPSRPGAQLFWCPIVLVPNCFGAQLSGAELPGAQLSWRPIVLVPSCLVPNCPTFTSKGECRQAGKFTSCVVGKGTWQDSPILTRYTNGR